MKKLISFFSNWSTALFFLALALSSTIKIASVTGNNFAFTIDQGRDLVDIRHMVVLHSPRLVGPTTSINGVLLGPFYYYFIAIPFILFGGSPASIVYWQILWFQLATIFLWLVLKRKNLLLANLTAVLLLLSPVGFYTARYFWNANAMPIFTILFVALVLQSLWSSKNIWIVLLGLTCGFALQIEAAFGVIFLPFAFFVSLYSKQSKNKILWLLFAFTTTLIPQALFELRHGFVMTKTLLAGLSGTSDILGHKLSLLPRLIQRFQTYLGAIRDSNQLPYHSLLWIYILGGIYTFISILKKRTPSFLNQLLLVSLWFIALSFCVYLLFSQNLKSWYTLGLPIFFIVFLGGLVTSLFQQGILGKVLVFGFLFVTLQGVISSHSSYLLYIKHYPSDDPSNLMNQLKAVDIIYEHAKGQNFKVYVYLPSVYDYTYQYLFWWYGKNKYGYMPSVLAYLPNQPEYIEDMTLFHTPQRSPAPTDPTFLLIESDENQSQLHNWINQLPNSPQSFSFTQAVTPKLTVQGDF